MRYFPQIIHKYSSYFETGTIGLAGIETIPFTPGQRLLKAQFDGLQDAPFILNKEAKRLTIDFGNSLPITKNGSHNVTFIDQLMVAIPKNKTDDTPVSCHDDLTTLGIVLYRLQNWYQTSGGVQSFPPIGVLSQDEIDRLEETPLIIAEVRSFICSNDTFTTLLGRVSLAVPRWLEGSETSASISSIYIVRNFGRIIKLK